MLLEWQPSVVLTALLLRQWHAKYHPDSGPLHLENADDLEQLLGDEIRREYPYFTWNGIHHSLMRRRQPVLLGIQSVRPWLDKYAPRRITRKRTAPRIWGTAGQPSSKRPDVSAPLAEQTWAAFIRTA